MTHQLESSRTTLLLVRSWAAAPAAIDAANRLLSLRRRHAAPPCPRDEVLGVWCRRQLEAELPVRESISVQGLWSLCWVDGPAVHENPGRHLRRSELLADLVKVWPGLRPAGESGAFCPVFDPSEGTAAFPALLRDLQDQHGDVVADFWFEDHLLRGLVPSDDPEKRFPPKPMLRRTGPLSSRRM